MATVRARDLRNPVRPALPTYFGRADLAERLRTTEADAELTDVLAELVGETTDDLGDL